MTAPVNLEPSRITTVARGMFAVDSGPFGAHEARNTSGRNAASIHCRFIGCLSLHRMPCLLIITARGLLNWIFPLGIESRIDYLTVLDDQSHVPAVPDVR